MKLSPHTTLHEPLISSKFKLGSSFCSSGAPGQTRTTLLQVALTASGRQKIQNHKSVCNTVASKRGINFIAKEHHFSEHHFDSGALPLVYKLSVAFNASHLCSHSLLLIFFFSRSLSPRVLLTACASQIPVFIAQQGIYLQRRLACTSNFCTEHAL